MELEYPYQLVAFLDTEANIGERVYGGEKGWYPQIALKRRFRVDEISEEDMLGIITHFCQKAKSLEIHTGSLVKPEHMPVKLLEVECTKELKDFHLGFISAFGNKLNSRYPDRDGENYYPHITAEFWGKMVVDVEKYSNKTFTLKKVCLLKDVKDEDSQVYKYFELG
ncbi:hypothetical protein KA043_03985 [Candidatus Saccharibacteria bacterium]|jgi:hypothetical protein|nr:hypothetical protein [Candidatus Saccharibacteria bacterium]